MFPDLFLLVAARYSFHINCGGNQVTYNGTTYDEDSNKAGVATFFNSGANWVSSNTGYFLDNEQRQDYTESKSSNLPMPNADDLYMTARLSPISLTYYGYCLVNGNYKVNLHFAEIMFSDNKTYSSLGKRIFDVYIQGKRELEDFNIANDAGGVGKPTIKNFTAVVTNNTLEIRFQWAGKGTTVIPVRSVYGPLISAISVESEDKPPENGSTISAGALVGIVAAGVIIIILVFAILWWRGCLQRKSSLAREVKALDLQMGLFSLRQIKAATNNFDITNKIGEGGFGPVYKGFLSDGTIIAVKQFSSKSKQGNGREEYQIRLDWPTRLRICVGIARGLAFLHEESRLKIVHRDIKATNVLLDKDHNPKISDFGLAKLDEEDNTHISTRIAGTYGYMTLEYAMHGHLTDKTDVYSFGIVALEICVQARNEGRDLAREGNEIIREASKWSPELAVACVSGRANTLHRPKDECFYLLDLAHLLNDKGNLLELVDRRMGSDFNEEEVMVMIKVALLCTNVTVALRPTMSSVVSMLEGSIVVPELVAESSEVLVEKKLEAIRMYYQQMEENKESEIQKHSNSMEGPWTASSSSAADLYPVHLDSAYWDKRN